jgi:hypothetical protein
MAARDSASVAAMVTWVTVMMDPLSSKFAKLAQGE